MIPAQLWTPLKNDIVACKLCRHYCTIEPDETGFCGVRINKDGALYTLASDKIAAANLDPVEKKPLYHFLPGTETFSIGTPGCNLSCDFCQNFSLSSPPRETGQVNGQPVSPERIVAEALESGAKSISYTYNEPTVFFELMKETAELAISQGLKNIIVSNGFQSPECLESLGPLIHAANIDLKSFQDQFYRDVCGARLAPVLENLKHIKKLGWWMEITTLLIPHTNDSAEELQNTARFIAEELGVDTPWHISRFHPMYKLTDRPTTPVKTLESAWEIGKMAGLHHVYLGNVADHPAANTICPACQKAAIRRAGYTIQSQASGSCPSCGEALSGVWS